MYSQCWIFLIVIILSKGNRTNKPTKLHIGALFDFDHLSKDNGRHELQAATIAINDINHRQKDLFKGLYTLTLLSNNSRVYKTKQKEYFYILTFIIFSVIQFMLLMLSFMQYFVVLSYFFLLVHHVQMKQKL